MRKSSSKVRPSKPSSISAPGPSGVSRNPPKAHNWDASFRQNANTLIGDTPMWHDAEHKKKVRSKQGYDLKKGTKVEVLEYTTKIEGNSKIKLIYDEYNSSGIKIFDAGTVGHISTTKLKTFEKLQQLRQKGGNGSTDLQVQQQQLLLQKKINDALYLRNMQLAGAVPEENVKLDNVVGKKYSSVDNAYELAIDQFNAATPEDGAIFWNGIQPEKLVDLVDEWNKDGKKFGQLEATTKARVVNKQFKWQGVTEKYFTEVSGMLGHAAKGHVTAVATSGLRDDSILTHTELPAMLNKMENEINKGGSPSITDMSFVIIEPKLTTDIAKIYNNNELKGIPIITKKPTHELPPGKDWIAGRDTCDSSGGFITIPKIVSDYWDKRELIPSKAAYNIFYDLTSNKGSRLLGKRETP